MVRAECGGSEGVHLVWEDLVDRALPWRHDSVKLAVALMDLYDAHGAAERVGADAWV